MDNNCEKTFRQIIDVSQKILNMYKLLIKLELSQLKNTDIYINIVKKLKLLINKEKTLYSELPESEISLILGNLFGKGFLSFEDYINACVILNDDNKMLLTRISFRLEEILNNIDCAPIENEQYDEYEEELEDITDEVDIDYLNALDRSLEEDIVNTIIYVIDSYVSNDDYKEIKEKLLYYKYMLLYIFADNEKDYFKSNFEGKNDLYWGMRLIFDMNDDDNEETLTTIKLEMSSDLLYGHGDELLNKLFDEIINIDELAKAIYSQIMIRVCSLFVDEKHFNEFKLFMEQEIEESRIDNPLIKNIIKKALSSYEKDIELPCVLSLKQKN